MTEISILSSKICNACSKFKSLSDFSKREKALDGHRNQCIVCIKIFQKKYREENSNAIKASKDNWRLNNLQKVLQNSRNWKIKNAEKVKEESAIYRLKNSEILRVRSNAWYNSNKEVAKKSRDNWNANNVDFKKIINAAWSVNNPEKRRIIAANRRFRKTASGGRLSANLPQKLFKLQKGKCACCNKLLGDDYHLDHIMPLALSGSNTDDNIQLLRAKCNLQKQAKHPVDFMQSRGFLL